MLGPFVCVAVILCLLLSSSWARTSMQKVQYPHDTVAFQPASDGSPRTGIESTQNHHFTSSQADTPACGVTKVSMLYGAHNFIQLERALESHRRHSERWKCGFEELEHDLVDRKLYSKHYFLMSVMLQELSKPVNERKQWLMWVDADSILLNPALSPEIFLPPSNLEHVYALVTADHNGLNDGIFYLRVHPSSVDLLTQITAHPLAHSDEDLGWFGEQAAMAKVIKAAEMAPKTTAMYPEIAWVPRMWFNAYQFETGFEGQPGHMMVHFAGLAQTRVSHMASWLDELQNNQAKWELPLAETFYETAISTYWREFSANATQ